MLDTFNMALTAAQAFIPVASSPVTTLTDFWAFASVTLPVWRQAAHQCSLCGDSERSGGHDSPLAPPALHQRSGRDSELGDTTILQAITGQSHQCQHIVCSNALHTLIDERAPERQAFLHLITPSNKAGEGRATPAGSHVAKIHPITAIL